ncbi:glycosyl hydrolase family 65 protein [Streptomyces sioyaensis]|uniref:glycosyl hydrolase family 65 protein n=1 Tax=Streptomyces sioyaensis TaxID=67364 RepID=UPI0033C7ABA5
MSPTNPLTPASEPGTASGEWVLSTDALPPASGGEDSPLAALTGYYPTFTGNGYLAARVPAAGNGFAATPVATQFHVAGLYTSHEGQWARKGSLPAWSALDVSDGSGTFNDAFAVPASEDGNSEDGEEGWAALADPAAVVAHGISQYRQSLDLRTGVITTAARWTSPADRVTDVRYELLTDRSRQHVAAVTVTVTPHWSGTLEVTDALDGRGATWTQDTRCGGEDRRIWLTTAAEGSGTAAALVSVLHGPDGAGAPVPVSAAEGSASQRLRVDVASGHRYTFTKYVAIATGHDTDAPLAAARAAAEEAAGAGWARLAEDNRRAWRRAWEADIVVRGDARLQRQVRAAKFYLLTSVRAGSPWSPSPAGLSSDNYNGHVFWDTETWIWPSLLAQHPEIAESVLDYRVHRLEAARAYAAAHGHRGARFPWESALDGREDTPAGFPFGAHELHISSDVALAFWQYWLATGDEGWLREKGWPVLRGVADFWASRAVTGEDGRYHIRDVIPPDEYADPGDDSVYTNVAARESLRFAVQAAELLGEPADPRWARTADGLVVLFDQERGVHPEFDGYDGRLIKQADVVMLAYPWENPQSDEVTRADLEYYGARTDDGGPSMTDSVHAIVHAQLGDVRAAFEHTRRSVDPFVRAPFDQFAEGRMGGAFTFLTGHGGFLQVFLYGYSGLRWRADRLLLDPVLPEELEGITLRRLRWRGRSLDIDIRRDGTTLRLHEGQPLPVESGDGARQTVAAGDEIVVPTRAPSSA